MLAQKGGEQQGQIQDREGEQVAGVLRSGADGVEPVLAVQTLVRRIAGLRPEDTPGQQQNFRAVLVTIDKWAAPREMLLRSITFGVKVVGHDGGHLPWTDPQVELAQQHARPDLARVITVAVNTGQRGSDIVRMRLSDISE